MSDPFIIDVDVRRYDWTVTVRFGDNVPTTIAEDVIEALANDHVLPEWLTRDVLAAAVAKAVVKIDPIEACDAGEQLSRAGTHPGECTEQGCHGVVFNTGLCLTHWNDRLDRVEARLAAQGFSVGRWSA